MKALDRIQNRKMLHLAHHQRWFTRKTLSDSVVVELISLDHQGCPLYYTTYNYGAALSTATDQLWAGGALGLNLSGLGLSQFVANDTYSYLGQWDEGKVRLTHQEFNGGNNKVVLRDNASNLSDHATHVAGTLVARGINPLIRGMAWQAQLDSYDWHADVSEMALAASRGMLISNHSYGTLSGWVYGDLSGNYGWHWFGNPLVNSRRDYGFGYYGEQTRQWDLIAHQAPYYLIVKAAGNDRDDYGPGLGVAHWVRDPAQGWNWVQSFQTRQSDGPYFSIGWKGNAKNILTVGAVDDVSGDMRKSQNIQMSNFSSWGPTNDGRIKPDICGNGIGVLSTSSIQDNHYYESSGTSMASPNVAGSLLLLQEHYENSTERTVYAGGYPQGAGNPHGR
ncbi:MAG: S8 family serine peptidase [Bacteroidia bacterium]|nr:S8 family serine peptidase [Bacteroidia bacterium]